MLPGRGRPLSPAVTKEGPGQAPGGAGWVPGGSPAQTKAGGGGGAAAGPGTEQPLASPRRTMRLCAAAPHPPSWHKGRAQQPPRPQQVPPRQPPPGQGPFVLPGSQLSPRPRPTSPHGSGPVEQPAGAGGAASPPRWPRCFVCREAPLRPPGARPGCRQRPRTAKPGACGAGVPAAVAGLGGGSPRMLAAPLALTLHFCPAWGTCCLAETSRLPPRRAAAAA